MSLEHNIKLLRSQGKSYREIQKIVNCSPSLICYHLGKGQKQKNLDRQTKRRSKEHPFTKKIDNFNRTKESKPLESRSSIKKSMYDKVREFHKDKQGVRNTMNQTFTVDDVINKFGETPKCYLTGEKLDISKPRMYHFDHIVPRTRGGSNTLDNLGLCTKKANMSKGDMTRDEYIEHCKNVLQHNGYDVIKSGSSRS